jgi:hypothetical protein
MAISVMWIIRQITINHYKCLFSYVHSQTGGKRKRVNHSIEQHNFKKITAKGMLCVPNIWLNYNKSPKNLRVHQLENEHLASGGFSQNTKLFWRDDFMLIHKNFHIGDPLCKSRSNKNLFSNDFVYFSG